MRVILILLQVVYGLSLIPWFLMIMFLPMAFDAGVSVWNVILTVFLTTYPLVILLTIIFSWIFYRKKTKRWNWLYLSPFWWVLAFLITIQLENLVSN